MTSTLFYQYAVHFAVMITIMLTMAIYLLVSKRNAFGSKLITDQRLRRKAGWVILIYVFVYLANIPLAFFLADNPLLLQMSKDSGFVSYNTFSRAFLTCTGISVSKWMKQVSHEE